jgi:hypothetical protein
MGAFVVKSRCHRQLLVPYYILLQVYVSNTVHISCTVDITHVLCTRLYTFHILTRTLGRRDRRDREAQLLGHVVRQAIRPALFRGDFFVLPAHSRHKPPCHRASGPRRCLAPSTLKPIRVTLGLASRYTSPLLQLHRPIQLHVQLKNWKWPVSSIA